MTRFRHQLDHWLKFYHREVRPREAMTPLVNGHDVMKEFNLSPGPLVGRLLRTVLELQWEGRVSNREEALREASQLLRRWGPRETVGEASHSP